jgi:hypothetical protein
MNLCPSLLAGIFCDRPANNQPETAACWLELRLSSLEAIKVDC